MTLFAFTQLLAMALWAMGLADIPFRTMLSRSGDTLIALGLVGPGIIGAREAAGLPVPQHGFKMVFFTCLLAGVPLFITGHIL